MIKIFTFEDLKDIMSVTHFSQCIAAGLYSFYFNGTKTTIHPNKAVYIAYDTEEELKAYLETEAFNESFDNYLNDSEEHLHD